MKLKIGDHVIFRGSYGVGIPRPSVITHIEHAPEGSKYGPPLTEIDMDQKDLCVFDLSSGNWAYGHQIDIIHSN